MSNQSQFFGNFPYRIKTKNKVIALTFDDGPNEPYTSQILDILDKHQVKATFFVVGKCAKQYPETLKKLVRAGHVVGNHSQSHLFRRYFQQPSFKDETTQADQNIKEVIGRRPALFRPPWLWRQPFMLRTIKQRHMQAVSGSFSHPLEFIQIPATKIANNAIKNAKPGAILIFHDGREARGGNRSQTVKAVELTVKALKTDGYRFVTVDELLGVPAYLS